MKLKELANKKILILGRGIEGQATLAYLKHYFPCSTIATADCQDGPDYLIAQKKYDLVIRSPGVPKHLIEVPYTTATNIFFANVKGLTIGITGSKGKSTTASLIFAMLSAADRPVHLVGNIGNPMLSELLKDSNIHAIWICELSSYQLDDINYSPQISVITTLFPEHMDYHGSVDAYYRAKTNILKFAGELAYFVYNPADPFLCQLAKKTKVHAIPFVETLPLPFKLIPLLGKHNHDNIRAAVTVARLLKISDKTISKAIKNFSPLPHRLQFVGKFKQIKFYDDAISTTPQSTICAIESLSKIGTIFLGGQDRGYDFTQLVSLIKRRKISNLVLFPDSGAQIEKLLKKTGSKFTLCKTRDMEEAVKFAYQMTPAETICLLSTASPSYSVWKNFEEKGDLFVKFVRLYGKS